MTEVWREGGNAWMTPKECTVCRSSRDCVNGSAYLGQEFSMMTCLPDTPSDHRPPAALPPTAVPKLRRHSGSRISYIFYV